jgi:2-keto-3-deoxy-L-rhamnonate aldolase RhmA
MKLKKQQNRIKNFRKKIKSAPVIGAWIQLPDINSTLLISKKNFDWFCFDPIIV